MENEPQFKPFSASVEAAEDSDVHGYAKGYEISLSDEDTEKAIKHVAGPDGLYFSEKNQAELLKSLLEDQKTREKIIEISKKKKELEQAIDDLVNEFKELTK